MKPHIHVVMDMEDVDENGEVREKLEKEIVNLAVRLQEGERFDWYTIENILNALALSVAGASVKDVYGRLVKDKPVSKEEARRIIKGL